MRAWICSSRSIGAQSRFAIDRYIVRCVSTEAMGGRRTSYRAV
jgi:hypothetical protein